MGALWEPWTIPKTKTGKPVCLGFPEEEKGSSLLLTHVLRVARRHAAQK